MHLGYTNTPATLWFDDVVTVITSPMSFSLVEGAKPWPGKQDITLLATSRQTNQFQGSIRAVVGKQQQTLPVTLEPGASRQVTVPITLPGVGAHNYTLSLLDSAGAPLRVLKGKFHTSPPLVLYPACPCYHAVGEGNGDTRIDARINVNPAQRAGLRLAVTATDASGKQIQTATADASKGDAVGLTVRLPINAPATFEITARLLDGAGKELAQAATDVHVSPARGIHSHHWPGRLSAHRRQTAFPDRPLQQRALRGDGQGRLHRHPQLRHHHRRRRTTRSTPATPRSSSSSTNPGPTACA